MYLSKLVLNARSRRVASEVRSPYEMHRTLSRAFIHEGAGAEPRALFRVEPGNGMQVIVLVQSQTKPRWENLPVDGGYFIAPPDVKEYSPAIEPGMTLRFRLRANPVKRETDSGKRKGLHGEPELQSWLERKGRDGGFTPISVIVMKEDPIRTPVKDGDAQHRAEFRPVLFEGILRVEAAGKFMAALASGVGPGKGFGFGLLSVGPVPGGGYAE